MRLAEDLVEQLRLHAEATYPEECCGLLIGRRDSFGVVVREARPCANAAPPVERRRRFLIDPGTVLDVVRALRGGEDSLIGFYHSHPHREASLSETDLEFVQLWPETVWLIVPVTDQVAGDPRAWWLPAESGEAGPAVELPILRERA